MTNSGSSAALKLSVIIANYNYGNYLSKAIDSALAIDWPEVQVIVVDDGSTDNSRAIMESYGNRIESYFQSNSGQRISNNVGYSASAGNLILFLDADDMVYPNLMKELAAVWSPGISKVQVQMQRVDAAGRSLGSVLPIYRGIPSPVMIRKWLLTSGEYPCPPGSGNVYTREFLERIFPLGGGRDSSTDSTCLAMAPILGQVVTIPKVLVDYRIHGANDSNLFRNRERFAEEIARAHLRFQATQDALAMEGQPLAERDILHRGLHLLQVRACSYRCRPDLHPIAEDRPLRIAHDAVLTAFRSSPKPLRERVLLSTWILAVLFLPRRTAESLIRLRFR
jgi:glycosyltransferase involved in cell wall biosynthesis